MQTRNMYLILRFAMWKPAIALLFGLIIVGFVLGAFGFGRARASQDLVCIGAEQFDLNDANDRQKVVDNLASWNVAPSKVLQRPPCDNGGAPVSPESIGKLFK